MGDRLITLKDSLGYRVAKRCRNCIFSRIDAMTVRTCVISDKDEPFTVADNAICDNYEKEDKKGKKGIFH